MTLNRSYQPRVGGTSDDGDSSGVYVNGTYYERGLRGSGSSVGADVPYYSYVGPRTV